MKISFYLSVFFLASIQLIITSCATVTFDVEHPPLVDTRGANSITIIPFEWNSGRDYAYLANHATKALLSGIKRGNINIVEPYSLVNTNTGNYSRYADIYIMGRIINVSAYDDVHRREEKRWNETRIITTTTRTVYVIIEYAYYRSVDNKNLGIFKKTVSASDFIERERRVDERRDRQGGAHGDLRRIGRDAPGYNTGRGRGNNWRVRQQRDEWTNKIAASAILYFSDTMDNELSPWTTTERRNIKRSAAREPDAADAKKLVRQGQYNSALDKFTAVYQKTGNVSDGYNTAVLLAARGRFTDALAMLQKIEKETAESGKKIPSLIRKEITKITDYINGYKILESAKAKPAVQEKTAAPVASAPLPPPFRMENITDDRGRILTQTKYNSKGETVSVIKNTWMGDNITSVTTTEGSNVKKTEYEYNASGGRTAQRDYNNGVLERQILTQGNREVEELYLNGSVALRAVWENGVKISEERIPAR